MGCLALTTQGPAKKSSGIPDRAFDEDRPNAPSVLSLRCSAVYSGRRLGQLRRKLPVNGGHGGHQTRELLPVRSALMSSGCLDLIGRLGVEVLPDGVVVYGCSHGYKQVPNGVRERHDAVTFEKDDAQTVAGSAHQQLAQPRLLRLQRSRHLVTF